MKKAVSIILTVVLTAAMSASVLAAEFVPSIEVKSALERKAYSVDGKQYSVVFTDPVTGEITGGVPESGVDFVSVAGQGSSESQSDMLKDAYTAIKNADSIKFLGAGTELAVDSIIADYRAKHNRSLTDKDLIVSDVFGAFFADDIQVPDGQTCTFAVKPAFTENDCFVVFFKAADGEWTVLNDVKWTEDGYLEITTDRGGVFAFAAEKDADLPVDPDGPDSPQTNNRNSFNFLYAGIAVLCVGAAVFFLIKAKKTGKAR